MKHTGILCNESKYQEAATQSHHAYHVCKSVIDHADLHLCNRCDFVWGLREKQLKPTRKILTLKNKVSENN